METSSCTGKSIYAMYPEDRSCVLGTITLTTKETLSTSAPVNDNISTIAKLYDDIVNYSSSCFSCQKKLPCERKSFIKSNSTSIRHFITHSCRYIHLLTVTNLINSSFWYLIIFVVCHTLYPLLIGLEFWKVGCMPYHTMTNPILTKAGVRNEHITSLLIVI